MTRTEDSDTKPLRLPTTDPAKRRRRRAVRGQGAPGDPAAEWSEPWLGTRTYRFATVEGALLAVTCVVALSMATEVWPAVELDRRRLRLRWPGTVELTPRQRRVWADLEGWVRELGGREVSAPEPEGTGASAGT